MKGYSSSIHSGTDTRASLLLQVRSPQNAQAWKLFVDLYTPLVCRYCRKRGLQEADIRDVAQEVFARVLVGIRSFEYDRAKGRFRSWLGTITQHEIIRHVQKDGRSPEGIGGSTDAVGTMAEAEEDPSWIEEFNAQVLETAIGNVRLEFSRDQWEAFRLAWEEEMPPREVAARLNRRPEWVYKAKFHVVQRLKEEVEFLAEDVPALQRQVG